LREGRIGGKGRGGRKRGVKGGEGRKKGLRGKIFREISGNPQTARSDKDLLRPKPETATHSGAITYPLPPPCLRPYAWIWLFFGVLINYLCMKGIRVRGESIVWYWCRRV